MDTDKKNENIAYANELGKFVASLLNEISITSDTSKTLFEDNSISLKDEINFYDDKITELRAEHDKMLKNNPIVFQYVDIKSQQRGLRGNITNERVKQVIDQREKQLKEKENKLIEEDSQSNNYLQQYWSICKKLNLNKSEASSRMDKLLDHYLAVGESLKEKISNLPKSEQDEIISSYVHSFYSNIDFEKINNTIGRDENCINYYLLNANPKGREDFVSYIKNEIEQSHKKEKKQESIDESSCYLELKTAKLSELKNPEKFFHFTRESYLPKIVKEGLRGNLKNRENAVGQDYDNPSIYFSDGEEALLKTVDVWIRWEYNRLTYKENTPSGDLVTDPKILNETFDLVFNDFKSRRYLSLDLVEGTDKSTSDFSRESEDFKKKGILNTGGPSHRSAWMLGPYTDWSTDKLEDWNMMTHIAGRYVEKDRITMLTDEHGRSDALSVLTEVYEKQKDKNIDCTYLDSFISFVKEKEKMMQENKCRNIGKDVIKTLEKLSQTDKIETFIENEARKIDEINISKEGVIER